MNVVGENAPNSVALYRHPKGIALPKPAKARISDVSWLSDAWVGKTRTSSTEERWSPPLGGAMLGVSRTVSRDKLVAFEYLRIVECPPDGLARRTDPVFALDLHLGFIARTGSAAKHRIRPGCNQRSSPGSLRRRAERVAMTHQGSDRRLRATGVGLRGPHVPRILSEQPAVALSLLAQQFGIYRREFAAACGHCRRQ